MSSYSGSVTNFTQEIKYECDKCHSLVILTKNPKDLILCYKCGYRILSKVRSKKYCEHICR